MSSIARNPDDATLTSRHFTVYEETRLIAARAEEIALGSPVLVQLSEGEWDPILIATKELKAQRSPTIIRRLLPNGKYVVFFSFSCGFFLFTPQLYDTTTNNNHLCLGSSKHRVVQSV